MKMTIRRVAYYGRGIARFFAPRRIFRHELQNASRIAGVAAVRERIDYYCKVTPNTCCSTIRPGGKLGDITIVGQSRYALDLFNATTSLDPSFALDYLFGDITHVPTTPAFVKSRPIAGSNENSILLPLNHFRHFYFPHDPFKIGEKKGTAVWRGSLNNKVRSVAVAKYGSRTDHDIGHTSAHSLKPYKKQRLGLMDQYRYRYILSLEGNDVATNLKWVMASNSAAVCPPLRYETWFMEGQLVPDVHYVGVEPDLDDLDEKINWYETHPEALERVVKAAHAWVDQFRDWRRQEAIARAVVLKYAQLTDQVPVWLDMP